MDFDNNRSTFDKNYTAGRGQESAFAAKPGEGMGHDDAALIFQRYCSMSELEPFPHTHPSPTRPSKRLATQRRPAYHRANRAFARGGSMLGWFRALMPKEGHFFQLFNRHAQVTL